MNSTISFQKASQTATQLRGSAGRLAGYVRGLLTTVLLGTIQAYKLLISPLLGNRCRFHPTCSEYAQQSVRRHGPVRGSWLAAQRLLRCGPWHPGGVDEVPDLPEPAELTNTGNRA